MLTCLTGGNPVFMKRLFALLLIILTWGAVSQAHEGLHEQIAAVTAQIKREPNNAELYLKRGELYRLHEDWQPALADYKRAEKLDPALFTIDLGRGKLLLATNHPRQALNALNRFLNRQPDNHEAWLTRARVLARLKQTFAALADYNRLLATESEPEIYLERARVYAAAGRLPEAIRSLDESARTHGLLVSLELVALDYELRQKLYDAALERLDRLAAALPRRETWLARRGAILLQAKRPCAARAAFTEALAALATLPPARRNVRANLALEKNLRAGLARAARANCGMKTP